MYDRQPLERFANWLVDHPQHEFSILLTPWGEALIHSWYQQTLVYLSQLVNVRKVAIQTNLSCSLNWIHPANPDRLALWGTFHPEWAKLDRFLEKCHYLHDHGIRFSVGVVDFQGLEQRSPHYVNSFPNRFIALRKQVRTMG